MGHLMSVILSFFSLTKKNHGARAKNTNGTQKSATGRPGFHGRCQTGRDRVWIGVFLFMPLVSVFLFLIVISFFI